MPGAVHAVVLLRQDQRRHRVCAEEVHQVCGSCACSRGGASAVLCEHTKRADVGGGAVGGGGRREEGGGTCEGRAGEGGGTRKRVWAGGGRRAPRTVSRASVAHNIVSSLA